LREMNIERINENIRNNKNDVNKKIATSRNGAKVNKNRDKDEKSALTLIAKSSMDKAKQNKKFIFTKERVLYYDPSG